MPATRFASPHAADRTPPADGTTRTREQLLAAVLDPGRLSTPPAVALQIVDAASRPNCDPGEIVACLALDPALCAKLLKAVNSCLYGPKQPVASVARALQVLGLNTVRSLALGLSLPAVKHGRAADAGARDDWVASVGGAIIARELSVLARRPAPDDDLVAGLLRDLGAVLLREAFAAAWPGHQIRQAARIVDDPCGAEIESFGIDHADVGAELLGGWNLPDDLVEPIRHHHRPEALPAGPRRDRAELLHFASQLVQLDAIAQRPEQLERLLATARDRFGLAQPALVALLQRVAPKIESFAAVLNQDISQRPDLAETLATGTSELAHLTVVAAGRSCGSARASGVVRVLPPRSHAAAPDAPPLPAAELARLPEFRPEFVDSMPAGGCRVGNYELTELIGRGTAGAVFKARTPRQFRPVAVKLLAPQLAAVEGVRQRFTREAQLAASIRHENVVAVYAVGAAAGVPYLATEYVRGGCLEARMAQHGPMPVLLHAETARQIAAALAAAHARGIVHRDLKPANVLIEDEAGRVKLTDFGLARAADEARAADDPPTGTPFYMAPEVIRGEPAAPPADAFALGAVLYLMATGKVPFAGQSVAAVFDAVCAGDPVPPRHLRPNLPEWLDELILRLLDTDPARRPEAGTVADMLGHAVG